MEFNAVRHYLSVDFYQNSTVDFREFVLTTAEECCIFASSLVKNEDESPEPFEQRSLSRIQARGYVRRDVKREVSTSFLITNIYL